MKLWIASHRVDETQIYEEENRRFGFHLTFDEEALTPETAGKLRGYDAVAVTTNCRIDETMCRLLQQDGVRYILTRSTGTDHINLEAVHQCGLLAANVPGYSPNAISEHTVLLVLMLLRQMRRQMERVREHDFRLEGVRARQLSGMIVGVIGAGRIGATTISLLSGFGCRILVNDLYQNEEVKKKASYVSLDELLAMSDVIILHAPMIAANFHLIGEEQIGKMKPGVYLINPARGGLVDTEAVCRGLQQGRIGGFGFDVYENEMATQRKDLRGKPLGDPLLEKLLAMDSVVYTSHTAFYTDEAIRAIAGATLQNLEDFRKNGRCINQR
ncbi:MAG: lactate dehydrogenase [Lachnospiraceae bacterium]|jgi:D-lactate dehydrogenase|nr:lactate dehydrogenase [Lachnospiraceae bacterium]MCH4032293.1 lactate dehydrogenase [Lachnospiraceae bacterium]MCH4108829.1 lactate dehydrogenase [Lachnospiraceae bacterium]MCI1302360.1 lactate dehydrogenase [Lachnospiraceae bacterium]MCI1331525.1 lactate dehydrogenase [Lachnospiraceae bacterium]